LPIEQASLLPLQYLDVFERLFITDNQRPFSPGIRSSVRVKQSSKRHFSDPSLACALLKVTPENLLGTLGFLFEALCERDLKIYAESFGGSLYHYQDYLGREIDATVYPLCYQRYVKRRISEARRRFCPTHYSIEELRNSQTKWGRFLLSYRLSFSPCYQVLKDVSCCRAKTYNIFHVLAR